MSRKPAFANLRSSAPRPAAQDVAAPAPAAADAAPAPSGGDAAPAPAPAAAPQAPPPSRQGRKQIAGFFTPEMSLAMHMLARRQDRSLQSLMAEAFNDVLRKHGESPIGD